MKFINLLKTKKDLGYKEINSELLKIKDSVFKNILSESTLKIRRSLLLACSITILIIAYHVNIIKIPWLEIPIPNTPNSNFLFGILATSVLYLLFLYLFKIWQDFNKWSCKKIIENLNAYYLSITDMRTFIIDTYDHVKYITNKLDEQLELNLKYELEETMSRFSKANSSIDQHEKKLVKFSKKICSLGRTQSAQFIFFDLGIPSILASYALFKTWKFIIPFFRNTIGM